MKAITILAAAATALMASAAEAGPRDRYERERYYQAEPAEDGFARFGFRHRSDRGRFEREANGPVYQSQEQVQQSLYDFSAGERANILEYQ